MNINIYRDLIKEIPVVNQSTKIKRQNWERFSYRNKQQIENSIFDNHDEVELSRGDVISETDSIKKIIMVLMWGYPTGGRGNNIQNILREIDQLNGMLTPIINCDLSKHEADKLINSFNKISGLGISTWSKLLFFFCVSIESNKCQIYDQKIVESLNKKQFSELGSYIWKQDKGHYYKYIELLNSLSKSMRVQPEQVELFLFYYNLYYKF